MNELLELREELRKTKIAIEQSLSEVECMIDQVEIDVLGDAGFTSDYLVVGSYACSASPVKTCVYDDEVDPAWDDCIFCGYPDERK